MVLVRLRNGSLTSKGYLSSPNHGKLGNAQIFAVHDDLLVILFGLIEDALKVAHALKVGDDGTVDEDVQTGKSVVRLLQ